jgi:hypothetical protein
MPAAGPLAPSRAARWPPTAPAPKTTIRIVAPVSRFAQSGRSRRWRQALAALLLLLSGAGTAAAQSLFARHVVDAQFATPDGKPMAGAEVRVFAPHRPNRPVETGRTDANGKFSFEADEDGMWTAEARNGDEVARVTIRVGGGAARDGAAPYYLLGGALAMLLLAMGYRVWRARRRR